MNKFQCFVEISFYDDDLIINVNFPHYFPNSFIEFNQKGRTELINLCEDEIEIYIEDSKELLKNNYSFHNENCLCLVMFSLYTETEICGSTYGKYEQLGVDIIEFLIIDYKSKKLLEVNL